MSGKSKRVCVRVCMCWETRSDWMWRATSVSVSRVCVCVRAAGKDEQL